MLGDEHNLSMELDCDLYDPEEPQPMPFQTGTRNKIDDDDDLYKEDMKKKYLGTIASASTYDETSVSNFTKELTLFEGKYCRNRMESTVSVLQFWKDQSKSTEFPLLSAVARVVLAAPGTQVSVESCSVK